MVRKNCLYMLILIALALTACGKNTVDRWQEQYELGMQYLEEGNYQEAIVAFTSAIEIDPNRTDAYIGRGDVYTAWAGELSDEEGLENYENALSDYEKARTAENTDFIAQKTETVQGAIDSIKSEGIEQWNAPLTPEEEAVLQSVVSAFASQDSRSINDALFHTDLRTIIEKYGVDMEEGGKRFDYGNTINGTGASFEMDQFKNRLQAYYGTWNKGTADGQGIMVMILTGAGGSFYSEQFEMASGSWNAGYAEGPFESVRTYFGGTQEDRVTVITGNLVHGLWDGEVKETTTSSQETVTVYTTFENGEGVPTGEIENLLDGSMHPQYGLNENGEAVTGVGGYDDSHGKPGLMWSQIFSDEMDVLNASLSYYLNKNEESGHLLYITN